MAQMSFFSAEAMQPGVVDLGGLLCGQGQVVHFAHAAARLSVVLDEPWRQQALVLAFGERGVQPELATSEEGRPLVRTAFRNDLIPLADSWTKGAVKAVPRGLALDGATLRVWTTAFGRWVDTGYLLGLDEHAPDTHEPLLLACTRIGLPVSLLGIRGGGPGLRLSGRRRIGRLVELVGDPPTTEAGEHWPTRAFSRSGDFLSRA
nr:hypothetical protein [Actinocrispum wychmicini]